MWSISPRSISSSPIREHAGGGGRRPLVPDARQRQVGRILIDAYRGPFVPFHLLTKGSTAGEVAAEPGGVVVQNIEPSTCCLISDRDAQQLVSVGRSL